MTTSNGLPGRRPTGVKTIELSRVSTFINSPRRCFLLFTTALIAASLAPYSPSKAQTTGCTYIGVGTGAATITCDGTGNTYPTGIPVANVDDLTMIVEGDVVIDSTAIGISIVDTGGNTIDLDVYSGAGISTTGAGFHGIFIDGGAQLDLYSAARIETNGSGANGIFVEDVTGNVDVVSSGDIFTNGPSSSGIKIRRVDGNLTLKSYGDIDTYGVGIELDDNRGSVTAMITSQIITAGNSARAIRINNTNKDVTVTFSGDIRTSTDTSLIQNHGILINNNEEDVYAYLGGSITTYSRTSDGIRIGITAGNIDLDSAAAISATGEDSQGIHIQLPQGATADIDVDVNNSVLGGWDTGSGVAFTLMSATQMPTLTISETGSLGAMSDRAIWDEDDALTINNYGTITGYVELQEGDDVFNNDGVWYLRKYADTDGDGVRDTESTATADFGAGSDSFNNTGTLTLLKGTTTPWSGALTNLEFFTNSTGGVIDLSDGTTGDQLTISGEFQSDGGSLHLDVVLDDGMQQADLLNLSSVTLPNGNPTLVYIENAGGSWDQTTGNGILLVEVAAASAAGAFDLGSRVIAGAYEYELEQVSDDWYLQSTTFAGVDEYPALVGGSLMAWYSDLNALHNHLAGPHRGDAQGTTPQIEPAAWTGPGDEKVGPWFQIAGTRQEIGTETAYNQHLYHFEGGIDGEIETANNGSFLIGAFAGLGHREQNFIDSTSDVRADSGLAGAYASYNSGGYYGHAIAKYEHQIANLKGAATNDESTSFDIDTLGFSLESGYRFSQAGCYLQPRARLSYAYAYAGSFEDVSGVLVDLKNAGSLQGELGTRLGASFQSAELYVDAGVRQEFEGNMEAEVSDITFTEHLPGTVGVLSAGVAAANFNETVRIALEGSYAKGSDAEEFTASGALQLLF